MLEQLEELLSHLNAEDNEMALEFKAKLKQLQEKADKDALWRECLEAGGVDNWSWYSESLQEYWDTYDY
ncbi:hypothetical protein HWD01_gp55 [Escherichia phage flopper]|uniref:Uncharacterized protein n=1 Tax=Escherichia phage flopper TaxID=2696397 RepID=A0A6B9WSX7_9CAUD|nr:hypothetical protein HWD01_gp55 [Escherichia phage flopper]QHR68797.1 hypothetical protein flopper_55 [Escherichia phage flopper]